MHLSPAGERLDTNLTPTWPEGGRVCSAQDGLPQPTGRKGTDAVMHNVGGGREGSALEDQSLWIRAFGFGNLRKSASDDGLG